VTTTNEILSSKKLQRVYDHRSTTLRLIWDSRFRSWAESERARMLRRAQPMRSVYPIEYVEEVCPSFPTEPAFFTGKVSTRIRDRLLGQFENVDVVMSSSATPSVEQRDDGVFEIRLPQRDLTVGLLRMLAHELGHVAHDSQHRLVSKRELVNSEISALDLERTCMGQVLKLREYREYLNYQAEWFKINEFAHFVEQAEIQRGHSRGRPKTLWALEWASSRVGFSDVLVQATRSVFPEISGGF